MKKFILSIALICFSILSQAQITTPVIRANFGVDADLRSNFFNGFLLAGNDDWFSHGTTDSGQFIIDTTGAAYINQQYISNPATRRQAFFRGMRYSQFSIVNGMTLIDGIFFRDHHGDDSTVFASGSNKNGMSPVSWSTPVSQGIPDKNDILDMAMHVRRAGVNSNDSLWMFGALSLDNTTGNRYFDFEMYQTDIVYNRPTLSFTGYGPDFGHTSWEFDAAGNITKAGDIIFTAEYSSSSLSNLEARIWIKKTDLSKTPAAFSWGGQFDGASSGSTYGYASIIPKTVGDFYTGLQCSDNTWGGPFGIVLADNSLVSNYSAKQLMEFSVNLTKLGLDPLVTMGNPCTMPFRRVLVKSRASTSFTAELKDFVGPFSSFRGSAMQAAADVPYICGSADIRTLAISNALATSVYYWSTIDGNIMGSNTGPSVQVNLPGTYIVSQQLLDSCGLRWARDTVVLPNNPACFVLNAELLSFSGSSRGDMVDLQWKVSHNSDVLYYMLERSTDNVEYTSILRQSSSDIQDIASYSYADELLKTASKNLFYRLKIVERNGAVKYSRVIVVTGDKQFITGFKILPNPVKDNYALIITSPSKQDAEIIISDISGHIVERVHRSVPAGSSVVSLSNKGSRTPGIYIIKLLLDKEVYSDKMMYIK